MAKSKQHVIPEHIRQQVDDIVKTFNTTVIHEPNRYYVTRHKGRYLYLDRLGYGVVSHVCRLYYTGSMDEWEFAIFKYSDECYDPEEWFFPGSNHVDGTIEGALKAGLEAYPD